MKRWVVLVKSHAGLLIDIVGPFNKYADAESWQEAYSRRHHVSAIIHEMSKPAENGALAS